MKLVEILKELKINVPEVKDGLGVEVVIDPKTAKKDFKYFSIKNYIKNKINEKEFANLAGQYFNIIESSINNLVSELNNRKKFAPDNEAVLDIVAWYDFDKKVYRIVATSDDGNLQLEYNAKEKRWV